MRLAMIVYLVACSTSQKPAAPTRPVTSASKPTTPQGHAKTFSKSGDGGMLDLVGDEDVARDHAEVLMAQHCGAESFTVIQDGIDAADGSGDPCALHFVTRIYYRCGGPRPEDEPEPLRGE